MSSLNDLDPILIPWAQALFNLAKTAGVNPRITSTRRSYAQQKLLYEAYIQGHSKYPAAAPGTSAHEYGLAFDMVVDGPGEQAAAGAVWSGPGWGGKYGGEEDPVHFEYPGFSSPTPSNIALGDPNALSIRRKAEQLADYLISLIPSPFQGILSTAVVASLILSTLGSNAASAIAWYLSHPAEASDFFLDLMWGLIRQELGF